MFSCPHCGNEAAEYMETNNGGRMNHPDLTILCTKPMPAKENSHNGEDGRDVCGMTWEPNQ